RGIRQAPDSAARFRAAVLLPVQTNIVLGQKICITDGRFDEHWSDRLMLKGTRDGILKRIQPISVHGQISWDVAFSDVDDADGQPHVVRIGPEAVTEHNMEPGDRIQLEYLVGVVIRISRIKKQQESRG